MPKLASGNRVKQSEIPDTLKRSSAKAQRTFAKAHVGGVDAYGNTKRELYERARKLGVEGRSTMSKEQLAREIAKRQ